MVTTAYEQVPATADDLHRRTVTALVERYGVLEEPPRPELQAIAALAAQISDTPMATVSVFTSAAWHQVAAYGIDPLVCRREDAMCQVVLAEVSPVVVPDCREDDRLRDNPFVNGERADVRFYASHHLVTPAGVTIGTLCVYDLVPRELDPDRVAALGTLAGRVVDVLELSLRTRELAVSHDRLSAFAGQVSHDLKTPLASVSLALGMLREEIVSAPDGADLGTEALVSLVDRALRGTQRMDVLVDEVLDHAHLTDQWQRRRVPLDDVLLDVLDDLAASLVGVRVVHSPLPVVVGSRVRLRALLQNLLDNAAKHRHPRRDAVVTVAAVRRPGVWRISVTDNGRGIPASERARVFEPRARLDETVPGSGIGLDTCRRVAAEHNGRMGVADGPEGPDVGVSVWFELPDRPDGPALWPVPSA